MWLKWSWRDLRSRWVQVAAIAIIIAFGTGLFSGLRSMNVWRGMSNEASYATVNTFDLRVELGAGGFVERGAMLRILDEVASASVADAEERLILPTQVSVETEEETVIVPGRLIGVDVSGDGPHVNMLHPKLGRSLQPQDTGQDIIVLEHNFAKYYKLPESGSATLSGDVAVQYAGQVLAPEYFFVITPEGGLLAQANFAAAFTSLETAQRITAKDGKVNDLLLTLAPGADEDILFDTLSAAFSPVGGTVSRRLDDPSIRAMIEDVEGDKQFTTVLAIAVFGGAVFAAFNLTSRIMDSQRREMGIAMALGILPVRVALRPLLFSAQVALLGVIFGIGMGIGVAQGLRAILTEFLPLPVWRTPFQPEFFAGVAVIGFLIPFLATAIPVWRAVTVPPIDAIKTGHLAVRSGGLAWLLTRLRIPGQTTRQIPFRNVARAPRRTLLTALGVAAIVTVLIMVMGMLDSFLDTFDRAQVETAGANPDRLEISLDTFYPRESRTVQSILDLPGAEDVETSLRLGGTLSKSDVSFDVFLNFIPFDSRLWQPSITRGSLSTGTPGVLISEKAAKDLDVEPGDTLTVRHPVVGGQDLFSLQDSELEVIGIHPHPFRLNVYIPIEYAGITGIEGATNILHANSASGVDPDNLKRELFKLPGVGSVQKTTASTDVFRDQFGQFIGILYFIVAAVMALAILIAYNTASINMDERQREHATMFAYGLPVRTVLGMAVTESAILGVISIILGLVGGYLLLYWVVLALIPATMPDLGMEVVVKPTTFATAIVLIVVAVAASPLLTVRRLLKMDVPSTLRVME
ncbi:MAG: FtsX-like permease family protein [Dehalococcoidia bacterium]|nr:FtsX-like permease family protein [Dehalococcoidia bacterium]